MINKKQVNKQQNKGSRQRTGQINGGVDGGDAVENLFIHDQKKSRNIDCSGIGSLLMIYQPHDGTALSGRSRRMLSVIRLIISFFIFVLTPCFLRVFFNVAPFFIQVKRWKIFLFFLFPALDSGKIHGILESVLR